MSQWGGCLRRIKQCLRRLLEDELDEEAVGLFEADKLELQQRRHQNGHANGHHAAHPPAAQLPPPKQRPQHKKQLRAKDASYSESIIQDFRKEEIPTELAKLYDLQDIVGIGTTSKVYKCKRRARPDTFACKVIDKRRLNMEVEDKDLLLEQLRKEIEILQRISHPNIVAFQEVVETANKIFVVMELVQGGELFEYLLDRGPLPEAAAVHIMRQVMSAIAYLHSQGVVHRDLKAENLLVVDPTEAFPTVKLIDFGFATILRHNLTGSFLGTGGYLAPEMRQQRLYSESVDIWACGVLLYLLLSCRLPFTAEVELLSHNRQQVERKFELAFLPEPLWKGLSESVKNLLRRMLAPDPMRRFTAQQVIRHPWILYGPAADQRSNTRPPPPPPVPVPPVPSGAGVATTGTRSARAAGGGALLENPQESSGTGAGLLLKGAQGHQRGGQGQGLLPLPRGAGSGNGAAVAIPASAAAAAAAAGAGAGAGAAGARAVVAEAATDGAIRHVRSSLNLERHMHQPFQPPDASCGGAPLYFSRTPPATRRAPLRSSGTANASGGLGQQQASDPDPHAAMHQRGRGPQKKPAVLVSYLPQTLHNAVAGDLSSTSNLSMKYAGMAQAGGSYGGNGKRLPSFGTPAAMLLSPPAPAAPGPGPTREQKA